MYVCAYACRCVCVCVSYEYSPPRRRLRASGAIKGHAGVEVVLCILVGCQKYAEAVLLLAFLVLALVFLVLLMLVLLLLVLRVPPAPPPQS